MNKNKLKNCAKYQSRIVKNNFLKIINYYSTI